MARDAGGSVGTLLLENAGTAGDNPKTSASTGCSLVHTLGNESAHFIV